MPLTLEYKYGVKREVQNALKRAFGSGYPDELLANKVNVTLEYPLQEERFPAIYITFREGTIRNAGVGHTEINEELQIIDHWIFSGQLVFNIMAQTPADRDMLAAGLINIIAFAKEMPEYKIFYDEIIDADWVRIQINNENIRPGGEQVTSAPWGGDDQLLYSTSYSIDIMGEFFSNPAIGELVVISDVIVYPYRPDQPVPHGSQVGGDATKPWI